MNRRITKKFAMERLESYYRAEEAILTSQAYKQGSRSLERAKLHEIRSGIRFWENVLAALETGQNPNAPVMRRVVPRDL
jgi:hypothetical protein